MEKEKIIEENFLNSGIFTFHSHSCSCKKTVTYNNFSSKPVPAIELHPNINQHLNFAYSSKVGLVRLNDDGSIAESNILGKIIGIKPNDIDGYCSFFKANGYLLPLPMQKIETIDITTLQEIVDRLHATVELISTITNMSSSSYEKIVQMIFYLLFMPIPIVTTEKVTGNNIITSVKHEYHSFIETNKNAKRDKKLNDIFNCTDFKFSDTISSFKMDADFVDSVLKGSPDDSKYETPFFKNVFTVYCMPHKDVPKEILPINDFMFHYFYEVGIIYRANLDKVWYVNGEYKKDNFNAGLKDAATRIAKYIIKEELERNLQTVRPSYNINKLEPEWKIDSLLGALYFGLFYMRPNLETYRRCKNPKCGEYFLVSVSSNKKKYCCTACMNRAMAARKRARDKIQESKKE